jgi:Tol biopolymer transport system component
MKLGLPLLSAFALSGLMAQPVVTPLQDPVTGRKITWYRSAQSETHHYYDISPWDPQGNRIVFFRFDPSVDGLTATGRFPGSLWVMNVDGSGARRVAANLMGNYHTGVNQFWGPDGESIYFTSGTGALRQTSVIDLRTGKRSQIHTPVPASKISADFQTISCVRGGEWGLYDIASGRYEQLVTLERALALTPNKDLVRGMPSALQNTRFNPQGGQILIVHRTLEDFPRLVEMFLYDFGARQLRHLADNLHHPNWRPDGKAVMFVRRRELDSFQSLYEVDVQTGRQTRLSHEHVPAGHPSYHPLKPHWIVTDCYGGPMGNGLALIDTRTGRMKQLVTIPLGERSATAADERFPFRNWGLWIPQRRFLNEPRPVWNKDGSKILFTSEESGRMNLYVVDTSDL